MPYKIPNTFNAQTPLGQSVSNLMSSYFNNLPTPDDAAKSKYLDAETAASQAKAALDQQKLNAPSGLRSVFDRILNDQQAHTSTAEAPRPTPDFVGPEPAVTTTTPGMGYKDAMTKNWSSLIQSLAESGNLGQAGSLVRASTPWAPGATTNDMDMAMLGAGDSYGSTQGGSLQHENFETQRNDARISGENNRAALSREQAPSLVTAKANASNDAKYNEQLRGNKEGAAATLAKVQNLRTLISKLDDGDFGPVAANSFYQAGARELGSPTQEGRDQVQSAIDDMALDVAKMKLKGQGAVSDAERALVAGTLPKLMTSKSAALDVLARLEAEANNTLTYQGTPRGEQPAVRPLANNGQPAAPAPAAEPGTAPVTKIVNGKTYVQAPDGWYEQ